MSTRWSSACLKYSHEYASAESRRVIYHGPVGGALPFFETLGFVCPTRKDPASFLQEVTTPKGAHGPCISGDWESGNFPPTF